MTGVTKSTSKFRCLRSVVDYETFTSIQINSASEDKEYVWTCKEVLTSNAATLGRCHCNVPLHLAFADRGHLKSCTSQCSIIHSSSIESGHAVLFDVCRKSGTDK